MGQGQRYLQKGLFKDAEVSLNVYPFTGITTERLVLTKFSEDYPSTM